MKGKKQKTKQKEIRRKEIRLPCGIVCGNCKTCILRHYAATEGRCWNCKALLKGGKCEK